MTARDGISIHDAPAGRRVAFLAGVIGLLTWRYDSSQVVATDGADAEVFDLPSGTLRYRLPLVFAAAWSHDASTLAVLEWETFAIRLHDARDGREIRRLRPSPSSKSGGPLFFTRDDAFLVHQAIENGFRVHRLADDATLSIRVVLARKGNYAAIAHSDDGLLDGAIERTDAVFLDIDGKRTRADALKDRFHQPSLLADFWQGRPVTPSGFRAILPNLNKETVIMPEPGATR
jgi:hypothetical protein